MRGYYCNKSNGEWLKKFGKDLKKPKETMALIKKEANFHVNAVGNTAWSLRFRTWDDYVQQRPDLFVFDQNAFRKVNNLNKKGIAKRMS